MNEYQKMLLPYVELMAEKVLEEKRVSRKAPLIATENEIITNIRQDALECMRELFRSGKYHGTTTLNQPALMKKEK